MNALIRTLLWIVCVVSLNALVTVTVIFLTRSLNRVLALHTDTDDEDPCQNVCVFSANGTRLFTGGADGIIRHWKVESSSASVITCMCLRRASDLTS
jgi:hypothetical protein